MVLAAIAKAGGSFGGCCWDSVVPTAIGLDGVESLTLGEGIEHLRRRTVKLLAVEDSGVSAGQLTRHR